MDRPSARRPFAPSFRFPVGVAVAWSCLLAGCENVVPRTDLQLMARTLPAKPDVSEAEKVAMASEVRRQSGVEDFEFSEFEFTPETRLPPGTEWILSLFLGE